MNKKTIISIVVAGALIILALIFTNNKADNIVKDNITEIQNVKIEQNTITEVADKKEDTKIKEPADNSIKTTGTQIIEITAKGGYTPRKSVAKAGIPTVLRFNTNGTFDCSSSVRIPSMNITKFLPQSGSTDIDLGVQPVGTLTGTCGMGMYSFEIQFQ